ncbi:MAG TPA: hypothetical protein VHI52_14530 [Verrucomicrobiae bacterium]|nr:hypothetical protein [Verrucomicrobiae bacterium]
MSLINDALKRVKAAQQQAPPSASVELQFKPIEPAQTAGGGAGWWVPLVFALVAVFGLILAWQLLHRGEPATVVAVRAVTPAASDAPETFAPSPPAASRPVHAASINPSSPAISNPASLPPTLNHPAEAKAEAAPVVQSSATPAPAGTSGETNRTDVLLAAGPAGTNQSALQGETNPVAANVAPTPPKPAPLKLQGIVFNPKRPSAVINGRTVFIGDRIREMRVLAITSETATLAGGGKTNILSLAE